jgi:hypothetical protein
MATITPLKHTPHTRIDNSIIDDHVPQIGLAGLGVLVIIKRYLNQKTGQCNPSYKTIARKAGVDRSTIIRYVKKLKALNLLDPELQFKEDGSPTSNQYNFPSPGTQPDNRHDQDTSNKGGAVLPPPPAQDCLYPSGNDTSPPGATMPPKQSPPLNKITRTISEVDLMPTEKQKTCPHPPSEIVFLADNVTICHHCYGLLDENLTLVEKDKPVENVQAA